MLDSIHALSVILLFILLNGAVLVIGGVILSYYNDGAAGQNDVVNALRYNGVLYLASNDKAVDVYRHTDTNAVYYKQGVQYRSAITGRIVSSNNALNGTY